MCHRAPGNAASDGLRAGACGDSSSPRDEGQDRRRERRRISGGGIVVEQAGRPARPRSSLDQATRDCGRRSTLAQPLELRLGGLFPSRGNGREAPPLSVRLEREPSAIEAVAEPDAREPVRKSASPIGNAALVARGSRLRAIRGIAARHARAAIRPLRNHLPHLPEDSSRIGECAVRHVSGCAGRCSAGAVFRTAEGRPWGVAPRAGGDRRAGHPDSPPSRAASGEGRCFERLR